MDDKKLEQFLQEALTRLQAIERNTSRTWTSLFFGSLLRGAGFILGTILLIALAGWMLSLLGVIPGLSDLAGYLHNIWQAQSGLRH